MTLDALLLRGDVEELIDEVERRVASSDWGGILELRDRCDRAAAQLGKQLWPVAHYAEYRLALDAPGEWAARVLEPGAARFALGPLTEVAAATHRWSDLADHIETWFVAATVAQERVIRGERLEGDPRAHADEIGLPLALAAWEPDYPIPHYRHDELLEDGPPVPTGDAAEHDDPPGAPLEDPSLQEAAEAIGRTWAHESNGYCHVAVVEGRASNAVAAVMEGGYRLSEVDVADLLARVAWSAASGGAYGRRKGMAAGRAAAWHLLAEFLDESPTIPAIGGALDRMRAYLFDDGAASTGWSVRVALEHRDGFALAIDAFDERTDDDDA